MDYKEIEECVIRAKEGSEEDVLKLIDQFKGYTYKTALSFYVKNYDVEDFVQVGYAAVVKAISMYKLGANTFSCYAMCAIRNAMLHELREHSKDSYELSLNTPINAEYQGGPEFMETIEDKLSLEDEIETSETMRELKAALEKLTEEEKSLIFNIYYKKMKVAAYAKEKGISYGAARKLKTMVLEKLRKEMK